MEWIVRSWSVCTMDGLRCVVRGILGEKKRTGGMVSLHAEIYASKLLDAPLHRLVQALRAPDIDRADPKNL